ncbi:hypothetical protein BBP40_008834 [Aspergillus hancockii]|nr:hypothetical protein BBP40_008834 [Aspergillus hancockii]
MSQPNFKVIIVGASIEGLTLAHCLYQAGINYLVLEKQSETARRKDEPTVIMPNGALIWDQLGLLDQMEGLLEPINKAYLAFSNVKTYELNFPEVLREWFGYTPAFLSK